MIAEGVLEVFHMFVLQTTFISSRKTWYPDLVSIFSKVEAKADSWLRKEALVLNGTQLTIFLKEDHRSASKQ